MINALQDGFSIFQIHFWMLICILLMMAWGQAVLQKILSKVFDDTFTEIEYFSLSLAGGIFPVLTWSLIYFLSNFLLGKIFGIIISALLFILPFLWLRFKKPSLLVVGLILLLLASIFVRLAFLQQALLPAYFDSAVHYLNIQNIINIYESKPFSLFQYNYYHLGYHFLSAALIHLFQFNITDFMLVFGQVILAILPISFFFLLKQITSSNTVAFFTCLVAGFGFHMPAHLINWGKYPALLSLVGMQFVFCLGYLRYKSDSSLNQKTTLNLLLVTSMLITTLIHSRASIVFAVLIPMIFIALRLKRTSIRFQSFFFIFSLIVLGVEIFYIQRSPVLSPLVERFSQKDVWILVFVLFLTPFSFKLYPSFNLFIFLSLCIFILLLFLPISLFNYGTQTLLDRPFVQAIVYISFSMLAGLGFAGLQKLNQNFSYKYIINFIAFGFILLNTNFNYDFYPSSCCQLVSQDDLSAIAWITNNTTADSKILISATQLYTTSYEPAIPAPSDAGVWILPLASRNAIPRFNDINLETIEAHEEICNQKIDYIYIGSMSASFNQTQLANQPNWYQPVFLLPKAQMYQVIGCG